MKNAFDLISLCATLNGKNEDYSCTHAQILAGVFNTGNHSFDSLEESEILQALEDIAENYSDDFYLDFDGCEYRIIADCAIWGIYVETIKDIVNECYNLNLDKIPAFIVVSIDWEETAHNAYAEGYGYTFATYDGNEILSPDGNYWIFRTN